MKKLCILFLCVGLWGCQKEVTEIKIGKTYGIAEQVQIEVIKTYASTQITPSNKNVIQQSLKSQDEQVFIDCLLKVTNFSKEQRKLPELLSGKYEINNQTYDLQMILETINYNRFTKTDTFKQNQERYVHLYCETSQENIDKSMTLYLKLFDQQDYQYTFTINEEFVNTKNFQSLGDVISLKNSQITLNQISQSKKIEPSNKGIFYSYIPTNNKDETFVYLQMDIHNLSKHTINLKDYLYCEYKINSQSYSSQIIMETQNHKTLEKEGNIESLQTRTVYFAIPIKDDLLKEKGIFEIFVEGQTHQIKGTF